MRAESREILVAEELWMLNFHCVYKLLEFVRLVCVCERERESQKRLSEIQWAGCWRSNHFFGYSRNPMIIKKNMYEYIHI